MMNREIKTFNETTFSLGGLFSRLFAKPGYNINIRGKNILYGRKQYKIRSDGQDPTFLRIKLLSDIRNRLGFPSVSANFVQLYINDQYMGFYVISDAYKKSWIEYIYGEKNTTTLYQCNTLRNLTLSGKDGCTNENDEVSDHSEWESFLSQVENAKSPEDLEDIFEIDHFMKEMALDYITGSMDHLIKGHNFYFYKQPNGKWIYLSYDFDLDFGIFFDDLLQTSYTEFFGNNVNLINTLIFKDPQRFEKALNEIVQSTMNPATLFPHIDELKPFIKPYVKLEKIPDANGRLPGRLNKQSIGESYSYEQWDAFTEFTSDIFSVSGYTYGLKYWILMKYRLVCNNYGIEGDPIYLDENYEYSVNEELNFANKGIIVENPFHIGENNNENNKNKLSSESFKPDDTLDIISSNSTVIAEDPSKKTIKCLAELIGYTCCSDGITIVYDHDEYGDWSYDINEHICCGLTPYEEPSTPVDDDCWSKELGYSCCKGCKVYETDGSGSWGYELDQWCGIPISCQTN